jgi:4-hydroxyphenylpyruvate dioxygenase-like putative hemolysin
MGFATVDQIGIVVPNLEKGMNAYAGMLRAQFSVFEVDETTSRFSGSSTAFRTRFAVAQVGLLSIELIEPVEGTTVHSEYLKNNGGGIHHLGFYVRSLAKSISQFQKDGYTMLMEGEIKGLGKFAYFHAPDLHSTIEALQLSFTWPVFLAKHARIYNARQVPG